MSDSAVPLRCVSTEGLAPRVAAKLTGLAGRADPIADAAFHAMLGQGFAANLTLLGHALETGAAAGLPYAAQALVDDAYARARTFDQAALERGSAAFASLGFQPIMSALGLGSLMTTYASPAFAHQLTRSGNLVRMAPRRLIETGGWLAACLQQDGLRPGAQGFRISVHVRLIHAKMRHALRAGGWDDARWGPPLSQLDQLHGILVFSFIVLRSLERLGIRIAVADLADVYGFWRAIGELLGVEAIDLVSSHQAAHELHRSIEVLNGPPSTEAQPLARALMQVFDDRAEQAGHFITAALGKALARALCHRFLDPVTAQHLKIDPRPVPGLAGGFGLYERMVRFCTPAAVRTKQARADFAAYLEQHFPAQQVTARVLVEAPVTVPIARLR